MREISALQQGVLVKSVAFSELFLKYVNTYMYTPVRGYTLNY